MANPHFSSKEIAQRGEGLYNQTIRSYVQDSFDGKIIVIDIETGDYEIGDTTLEGASKLRAKRPEEPLYSLRIGYDAVYSLGGFTLRRTKQLWTGSDRN